MAELQDAIQHQENWDSYGAGPTTTDAVITARAFANSWVPCNEGLMLDLSLNGQNLSIDIGPDGKIAGVSFDV